MKKKGEWKIKFIQIQLIFWCVSVFIALLVAAVRPLAVKSPLSPHNQHSFTINAFISYFYSSTYCFMDAHSGEIINNFRIHLLIN